MRNLLFLSLIVVATTGAAAPRPGAIIVAVSGVPSSGGQIHIDVCPERLFMKPRCPWSANAPAATGTTTITIPNVPPGRYAVQAYHDANRNGKADRNMIGMPTELIGFSNDVRVHYSRPRFADVAITHSSDNQKITFALHKIP